MAIEKEVFGGIGGVGGFGGWVVGVACLVTGDENDQQTTSTIGLFGHRDLDSHLFLCQWKPLVLDISILNAIDT